RERAPTPTAEPLTSRACARALAAASSLKTCRPSQVIRANVPNVAPRAHGPVDAEATSRTKSPSSSALRGLPYGLGAATDLVRARSALPLRRVPRAGPL